MLADSDWVAFSVELRSLSVSACEGSALERLQHIQELAEQQSGVLSPARCELLMAVALIFFYQTPEPRYALRPSWHALKQAEQMGEPTQVRKALTLHAIVCADTMDVGMAIHCYYRAISLATSLGDREAQVIVLNNLGSALMISAAYSDAVDCYNRAVRMAASVDTPLMSAFVSSAKANIALGYLHLDRPTEGIAVMDEALLASQRPRLPYELVARTFMESTYTQLLLIDGRPAEARVHATLAERYAEASMSPRASIAASNAKGLVQVFEGLYERGLERLRRSLDMTEALRAARRDTLLALVMACEQANRIDLAVEYQEQLMAQSNRTAIDNLSFHDDLCRKQILNGAGLDDKVPIERTLEQRRLSRLAVQAVSYDAAMSQFETFERIAAMAALREDPSGGHPYRVARLVSLLAGKAGLGRSDCRVLDLAARLHDIGNVAIPDRIMLMQSQYAPHEYDIVKAHTVLGGEVLSGWDTPEITSGRIIARSHHERWDGYGYPDRLSGEGIPLSARLTSIAETYDALTHTRPHRGALEHKQALDIIFSAAGTAFDPDLVNLFMTLLRHLRRDHVDLDEFLEEGARASKYIMSRRAVTQLLQRPIAASPRI